MNKSDPVSRDALQERIHREMMDNLDEELELELDDSRLGRLRTEIGEPALEEPGISISRSCCVSRVSW